MRFLALIAVAVLAAASLVVPEPPRPVPHAPDPAAPAPYSVCPLAEAARRSTVVASVGGAGGVLSANVFSGGDFVGEESVPVSEGGTGLLEVSQVTGLARAPLLIGLDDPGRALETVLSGAGVAAAVCGPGSADPQVLAGGGTAEGESYTLVLTNPFAGSATVDVLAASEVGTESEPALEGIVVPSRSLVPVDLSGLLPGRQTISTAVLANQGRVVVGAVHESAGDVSAVGGLVPALDWYLPLPAVEGTGRELVLFAPGTAEVPFQLDVYAVEGLAEAAYEDVVPARGQVVIPAGDLLEGPGVVRVVAAGPVAAVLRLSGEGTVAVIPGITAPGPSWLLPGAGRLGDSTVHVFNPGEVTVAAQLLSGTGSEIEAFEVPADAMIDVALPERGVGARVEADGEVVATWTTTGEAGLAGDAARVSAG